MPTTSHEDDTLLARRQRVLSPSYRLFYEEPIHAIRGEGVWIYDAEGRRYLDAYNNVPVVGHCHPHVVEQMAKQASVLNTHTRYLTDKPVELAARLLGTMPTELSSVIFTNSGSEANDLAVRTSRLVTGNSGIIVTDCAYHGTTDLLSGLSPVTGLPTGPGVFTVSLPLKMADAAEFRDVVRGALDKMREAGIRPAALLVDTIFGSDGAVSDPAGFLKDAVDDVRREGGLFIADEVQPGFGRTGAGMWGFARHGVVPDIVTMGKPMGNGYPVASAVLRRDLAETFSRHQRYFNTFGGNTVGCATALAVLCLIRKKGRLRPAGDNGAPLKDGLPKPFYRHDRFTHFRGARHFLRVLKPSRGIASLPVHPPRPRRTLARPP